MLALPPWRARNPPSRLEENMSNKAHDERDEILKAIPTLDRLLEAHADELGDDFIAYRNHAYRLVNLCLAFSPGDSAQSEKIATAAAFHDLGIWTEGTFDYLQPSVRLACAHLARSGREDWTSEISEMILKHHKITPYRLTGLAERFRRADWVDVSMGLLTFGLSRKFVNEIRSMWPSAGFHKRLVQLELHRLRTHPWNPLPMVKL
jgi:hypothetical protein